MKEIHLQDTPYYCQVADADLVVSEYEIGDYCGSGEALVYRKGLVEYWNLSHCSCYGPFDGGPTRTITLDDFKQENSTVLAQWSDKLGYTFLANL